VFGTCPAPRVVRASLPVAVLLAATGCERVVDVRVPDAPPRLVVEARLERVLDAVHGRQAITLTRSQPYFSRTAPEGAAGATVSVTEVETGRVVPFAAVAGAPGRYATDSLEITTGREYALRIEWNGERFEGRERALAVPRVDSLYFVERRSDVGPATGVRAAITFRDPAGVANWYIVDQFVNGVRLVMPDTTFIERATFSDAFRDGRRFIGYRPYEARAVQPGDTVVVRFMSIPELVSRWFDVVNAQTLGDGSPFATPPASARGNVRNLTRPDTPPFGYFYVTEVSEVGRRVP
jgi:hypothetical protein